MLYVQSITGPFMADLLKGDPKNTNLNYVPGLRAWTPGPQGLPLFKPPYGRITAIDMNRGRSGLDGAQRRRPARPSAVEAAEPSAARTPGPQLRRSSTKTLLFVGEGDPIMSRLGSRLLPEMPLRSRPAPAAGSSARTTRRPAPCSGKPSCRPAQPARR